MNRTVPLDGTYYLTADGTADKPIVIKARGRRRGDLRRRRQLRAVRRAAADYTYFEGITFRNTDIRHPAPARSSCRRQGADREALPLREGRRRRLDQLLGVEQLLHRRQLRSSAATIRTT